MRDTYPNQFLWTAHSTADGTQPSTSFGTSVTPGTNSYGSYVQLISGASVTDEVWEFEIRVDNVGINAAARNCVIKIGLDEAGGTSYTDFIVDLLTGPAGSTAAGTDFAPPVKFVFPVRIPAGASVAAAASVNSATLTAIQVSIMLRGRPTRPDVVRRGVGVDTFGATPASSSGTSITPGTASEGSWTQIGSAAAKTYWYWEVGWGLNTSTSADCLQFVDVGVGDASNKQVIIANAELSFTVRETIRRPSMGRAGMAVSGDLLYVRAQASTTVSGQSCALYGVWG